MDRTQVNLTKIQLLRELAGRFEQFAKCAADPDAQNRYLKVADVYWQRARAQEQDDKIADE